jgi:putative hydrolase of the HAD superfamily
MSLSNFKILTFDVVGTLIDFEQGVIDYVAPIAAQSGVKADREAILLSYGEAEHIQHGEMPGQPFPPMLTPIYRHMAKDLGLPYTDELAEGLRLSIPQWPAFKDSVEALKRLRKHFRLVAMTNSDNWALSHFAQTLSQPFHDLVTAEIVETCKPDPLFFAFARGRQSMHHFKQSDYLHVAQSQYHDIAVAKELGYKTCWIQRRKGLAGHGATPAPAKVATPDYHFATLAELADAVERAV